MEESDTQPFNPLDKKSLANTVAEKLLSEPLQNLPPDSFQGAGIYAIYYNGHFPLYDRISNHNQKGEGNWPIYVGKAVPAGARKGLFDSTSNVGTVLFKRIREHARSIEEAENLNVIDFQCRFLVVDDIWIPLGESLLIQKFQPLWNVKIDGFGNHAPGGGRGKQKISIWDSIHPGRPWAKALPARIENMSKFQKELRSYILATESELFK